MFNIDAAARRYREANPPPEWWPFPPEESGLAIDHFFPMVGTSMGEIPGSSEGAAAKFTDADILDATFPGDRVCDIVRRLGCKTNYMADRRRSYPLLAAKMDAKRRLGGQP